MARPGAVPTFPKPGERKINLVAASHARLDAKEREIRGDSWMNAVTQVGTAADKRLANRIFWENRDPEFYEQLYAGDELAARIVDLIPEEALRKWVQWTGIDKKQADLIEKRCQQLDVKGALGRAWKWARAYGGSCLHIVTDTDDPASPLRRGEKVIGLRDLSRWDLRILTTDIEYDFGSPNWGMPRLYYLNVQMGSQFKGYPIHWSRMIRFDGQLVPRRTYIRNNYWHDSILNRLYNVIRNYQSANDAASSVLQDFNVGIYKMKDLAQMIAAGKSDLVKERLEMLNYSKSTIRAMILDPDGEEFEDLSRSVEGLAELLVHQGNRLVAATDYPHTKLLGESPDGSNATGNSTSQQWYDIVGSEQENYLRPKVTRLTDILFPEIADLAHKYRPLRHLDDLEQADMRLKMAQADEVYLDREVVSPSEIAESRFGGEIYSFETTLDEEAREALAETPVEGEEQEPSDETQGAPETATEAGKGNAHGARGDAVEGEGAESRVGGLAFQPRDEKLAPPVRSKPKVEPLVSLTMSLPMRDPKTDPKIKGPGVPNRARTFLPTRGNGVTAPSGFDFEKDAGSKGVAREAPLEDEATERTDAEPPRAATIIVRRGDEFLMGRRRDTGRWTLPGGMVEENESLHAGALRELLEETGLAAKRLKFLGSRLVESKMNEPVTVGIYELKADAQAKPSGKADPDKEIGEWRWLSTKAPLSPEIAGALQHANNVALDHLGLL